MTPDTLATLKAAAEKANQANDKWIEYLGRNSAVEENLKNIAVAALKEFDAVATSFNVFAICSALSSALERVKELEAIVEAEIIS